MGKRKKRGTSGIAAQYITRTQAIKKLQLTLKDFRRLCILKGIYPRDPKKKPKGGNKTYYHIKDIKFLAHEPLINKFRQIKSFLRKHKRAITKQQYGKAKTLDKVRPYYGLDHLVKERYPTFVDALRDLDDAMCMVSLFAKLPTVKGASTHSASYTSEGGADFRALTCQRIVREFMFYVAKTKSLIKSFVSVKGIYYQAIIMGQSVTWIVPHSFSQNMPSDVDFRIMFTFLEFYTTLLKFVNFKLFHSVGLEYPPKVLEERDSRGLGLAALQQRAIAPSLSGDSATRSNSRQEDSQSTSTSKKASETRMSALRSVLAKAVQHEANDNAGDEPPQVEQEDVHESGAKIQAEFAAMDAEQAAASSDAKAGDDGTGESNYQAPQRPSATLFRGCKFFLAREVPRDSLEFLILNMSGEVVWEGDGDEADETITHQVVDRPQLGHVFLSRVYVVPQYVYDCLNSRLVLPPEPYGPGLVPPPHLSPFVNDRKAGYIPDQRLYLEQLAAAAVAKGQAPPKPLNMVQADDGDNNEHDEAQGADEKAAADAQEDNGAEAEGKEENEEEEDENDAELEAESEDDEEERYTRELEAETKGVSYSAASSKVNTDDSDHDGQTVDSDSDQQAPPVHESKRSPHKRGKNQADSQHPRQQRQQPSSSPSPKGKATKRKAEETDQRELAKIMMTKKQKWLLSHIEKTQNKKKRKVANLERKRQVLKAQSK